MTRVILQNVRYMKFGLKWIYMLAEDNPPPPPPPPPPPFRALFPLFM
jgi:hypothetical protein